MVLSAERMKRVYGAFYNLSGNVVIDRARVPVEVWPLVPYAEFWGISDHTTRDSLVQAAPDDVQGNLKAAVAAFDGPLDDWLAGPESELPNLSMEFVAFTALTMAADYV